MCVCVCSMPSDVIMKGTQPFPAAPSNNQDSIGHHLCGRHAKRKDNIVPDMETITFFHKEQHGCIVMGQGAKSITTVLKRTSSYLRPAVIAIISLKNQTQIGIMIFKDLPRMPIFFISCSSCFIMDVYYKVGLMGHYKDYMPFELYIYPHKQYCGKGVWVNII